MSVFEVCRSDPQTHQRYGGAEVTAAYRGSNPLVGKMIEADDGTCSSGLSPERSIIHVIIQPQDMAFFATEERKRLR
jgi:hypothetical protein